MHASFLPRPPDRARHEQPADEVVIEILEVLAELGVVVEARANGGLYYAPRKAVGRYLRELMRQHKGDILERLERRGRGAA